MSTFTKAQRSLTNPTIAITGPTGSGKTMSALRLANGIAKKMKKPFAVIDTENGSASLYSDLFEFDTLNIKPPFTTEKYIEAINLAEKAGYCALVVDSMTHAWAGEGGLLEQKDLLDSRPNSNRWTNWGPIKVKESRFKSAYLHSTIPFLISTIRSKMEYSQTQNVGEKAKVQKIGMAPVQSDGIEYEFSLVLDVAMNHEAEVTKDRTNLFKDKKIFQITEEIGAMLVDWRSSGKPLAQEPAQPKVVTQEKPVNPLVQHREEKDAVQLDSALFEITFGKYKGKKIGDVDMFELDGYVKWVINSAKEKNKPITGIYLDFVNTAEAYLASLEGQDSALDAAKASTSEEILFS